jgi:glycosyltransferase involved in cell wall biosynthesis
MTRILKVAIDARLPDMGQGGVQQVINTLASGFSDLQDNSVDRCWLVLKGTTWWKDSLPAGDEVIEVDPPFGRVSLVAANRFPRLVSVLFPLVSRLTRQQPLYDDELVRKKVDLVHLPFQDGFTTRLPVVYHPHDLQHRYFAANFSSAQINHRETVWKAKAQQANVVMAASPYVVSDLKKFWNISADAIHMIPIPPPERRESDDSILKNLPEQFILYPAAFWSHKNHDNLLRALKTLQEAGTIIPLVLVGAKVGNYAAIDKLIHDLNLQDQVRTLGHVSNSELTSLLINAQVVAIPSLFEAMSLTVWDAQKLGTPVACSDVAPFPCQVGITAHLFDPFDPKSIAEVLSNLWSNESVRRELREAALTRTGGLTARNYASAMIGVYQSVMGYPMTVSSRLSTESLTSSVCSDPV